MSTRSELVRYSDVVPKLVEWVWPGYLPAGMFWLIDGDPGLGKSTLTADLAARISTGRPLPDGAGGGRPRGVVLMSAEDDRGQTIRPRLDAAGADPTRVMTLDLRDSDGSARPPLITREDLDRLERIIRANDAALLVFDPLTAYLPDGLDTNRDANVRRVLYWLAKLAGNTGCAVLGLRHFRKSPSENPLYRGGGSIAFVGAARAAFLMASDPDEPGGNRRILAPTKMNVGPLPPSLAFRLVVDGPSGCPHLVWEGPTAQTAVSLSAFPNNRRRDSERERAAELLADLLADGPLPATEVSRRAVEAGVSARTLKRAREDLGVEAHKVGRPGEPGFWVDNLPKVASETRRVPTAGLGTLRGNLAPFEPTAAVEDDYPGSAWNPEGVPA
jgi:hypothetical protein